MQKLLPMRLKNFTNLNRLLGMQHTLIFLWFKNALGILRPQSKDHAMMCSVGVNGELCDEI